VTIAFVLSASADRTAGQTQPEKSWRLQDREFGGISGLAVSPDGKWVGTAGIGVELWNASTGKFIRWFRDHRKGAFDMKPIDVGVVGAVVFSPDSKSLISAGSDGTVRVNDTASGRTKQVLKTGQARVVGYPCPLYSVAVSRDGSLIAAGGYHGGVEIWEAKTGKLKHSFGGVKGKKDDRPAPKPIPAAKLVRPAVKWNVELNLTLVGRAAPPDNPVWSLDFSADGKRIAAGYAYEVRVWDLTARKAHRKLDAGSPAIFAPGERLITATKDSVVIWNTAAWKRERVLKGMLSPLALVRRKSKTLLAVSTSKPSVELVEIPTGKIVASHRLKPSAHPISAISASTEGRIFAAASDGDRGARIFELGSASPPH